MYYLDYDSGRLYEDVSRTRLVESIAVKYGDTVTLPLLVLDTAGKARDLGTDVLRFGARLNGVQVLLVDGAKYVPTMSGAVVSPAYDMIIPINTTPIKTALASRPCVCLDGEFERETYTGWHVSSQTIAVHVQADVVDKDDLPAVDLTVPLATEAWVREIFSGVVAGTLPGFDVDSTTMTAPGTQATVTLDYIESQGKYGFKFYIPKTPGEPGAPGTTPTLQAGTIDLTNPGTQASFRLRTVGATTYALDLSLPLNKGEPGVPGVSPTLSIGAVSAGIKAAVKVVPVGASSYKLDFVLPKGEPGVPGDTGPAPSLSIGEVLSADEAGAAIDYDGTRGYVINLSLPRGGQGIQGIQGIPGSIGPAPVISVGTVSSGSIPSVGITGNNGLYTLNFVLPRGAQGPKGDPGDVSAAQLATKLDKPINVGTTGQVLVKTTTGSEWGVGGGDVVSDGDNVYKGSNQYFGPVYIGPADSVSKVSITSTISADDGYDGPPVYIQFEPRGALSFLDFLVGTKYDTEAAGGAQDSVRLKTDDFTVEAGNDYGIVNIGRMRAYAVPKPAEDGSEFVPGLCLARTITGTEWTAVAWTGGVVDKAVSYRDAVSFFSESDTDWPWARFAPESRSLSVQHINAVPPNIEYDSDIDTSIYAHALMHALAYQDAEARVGVSSERYGGPACYLSITTQSADAELVTPASGSLVCAPREAQDSGPCPLKMRPGQSNGTAYTDTWLLSPDNVTNVAMVEAMLIGRVLYAETQEFATFRLIVLPPGRYQIQLTISMPVSNITTLITKPSVVVWVSGTGTMIADGETATCWAPNEWVTREGRLGDATPAYDNYAAVVSITLLVESNDKLLMSQLINPSACSEYDSVTYCIRTA